MQSWLASVYVSLSYLLFHALIFWCQTCRRVYDIISRSISLQYLLELAANGMQHGSHSPLGKMQSLEMLAAHETAWRALSWTGSSSVDTLIGRGEPVSVSGNVLCFRTISGTPCKELLLLRAPSKLRNVVGKTWRVQLPYDTQDVCIDAAQDLLICRWCVTSICIPPSSFSRPLHSRFKSFQLLSLSSGKSHPLAQHVGVINATSTWRYRIGSLRICGDNFAVACEQGLYISVWNWKSGEHISDFVRYVIQMKWYPIYADCKSRWHYCRCPSLPFSTSTTYSFQVGLATAFTYTTSAPCHQSTWRRKS